MNWQRNIDSTLRNLALIASKLVVEPRVQDRGRVRSLGDGVARVEGLNEVTLGEVVVFATGVRGQVMDLDRDALGCVLFGSEEGILADSTVIQTGRPPSFPVGEAILGRVVDVLGQPRDGLEAPRSTDEWPVERAAPGALDRQPIRESLLTGIKAIDAVIPIGLGQRELILGDRETGKTSLALDAIINQRGTGVVCIYVSIGQKRSSVVEVVEELRHNDALAHTAVLVADASEPSALLYLAPYAGATLAEWFAARGRPALIVYDDLTRHADAYRSLSLILRHPPGREAYPGDVFSLHARLLERAFRLHDRLGGGSVTALPIVETQRGNITGFIPTNLISITDGQLFLDTGRFARGQLPAIDVGRSVSRIGQDAQSGAMRSVAANLRLEIAQYEDIKDFARFGAILDNATKQQLRHGERIEKVLAQNERDVMPLAAEIAELWALKEGILDDVALDQIPAFERQLRVVSAQSDRANISEAKTVDEELTRQLAEWVSLTKNGLGPAGNQSS
jgi:F-type H+-transporting ATPase subunit alpha